VAVEGERISKALMSVEKPLLRGIIRFSVLLLLEGVGKYGYQIYRLIKSRLYNRLSLSTLYTILKELESHGIIERVGEMYVLTDMGVKVLEYLKSKYKDLTNYLKKVLTKTK